MKLYYSPGACSLVVRIIINELGLHSEYESVNLKTKQTEHKKDFLSINPKGAVPALQLDNGEILTENAVILQFLADRANAFQLLPETGDIKRYRVLEWLNYITTELHKTFGAMFNPAIPQELKDSLYLNMIKTKLTYVNKSLKPGSFLFGDHFTLPDAYLYVMLRWAQMFQLDLKEWSNLKAYFSSLSSRKSIIQSLKEEE